MRRIDAVSAQPSTSATLAPYLRVKAESAARRWRVLNSHELLPAVIQGVVFQDGLRLDQAAA